MRRYYDRYHWSWAIVPLSVGLSSKTKRTLGKRFFFGGGAAVKTVASDFGSYDVRTQPLNYANPQRPLNGPSDQWFHITCPLDYFPPDKVTALYNLLGNTTKRTIEPRCGAMMQDIKGTPQGNWFTVSVWSNCTWSRWGRKTTRSHT